MCQNPTSRLAAGRKGRPSGFWTATLLGIFALGTQSCFISFDQTGDDDTSVGDDDTSVGDDDTSVGDDDTSVGDDDTSVGDDDTSVQDCADDSLEENDSIPTAYGLAPGSFASLVVCPGDDDYYTISVPPGEMLVLRANFLHDEGDIDVTITDPQGLTFDGDSASDNEEVETGASTGNGMFTVKVFLFTDTGGTPGNTYQLQLSVETHLGDDDDTGDDDDSLNCAGPTTLGGNVELTDSAGNPSLGLFSVADPLTVNVEVEHLSGADHTSGWITGCLANVLLINPLFPQANQDQLQMRGHACPTGCCGPLTCGGPPHQASVTIVPFGFASYDFLNPPPACCNPNPSSCPDISLCGTPLPSGLYQVEVDFNPTLDPTLDSIVNPQPFLVTIREGAVEGECNDTLDNDADGQPDCADLDCAGKDGCP